MLKPERQSFPPDRASSLATSLSQNSGFLHLQATASVSPDLPSDVVGHLLLLSPVCPTLDLKVAL